MKALPFELVNHHRLAFDSQTEETVSKIPDHNANILSANVSVPEHTFQTSQSDDFNKLNRYTLKTVSIDAEYEMILEALKKANFNKSKAAKLLNVDRKTLYNKMKQYNEFNEQ